jgi:hypothetical protein
MFIAMSLSLARRHPGECDRAARAAIDERQRVRSDRDRPDGDNSDVALAQEAREIQMYTMTYHSPRTLQFSTGKR